MKGLSIAIISSFLLVLMVGVRNKPEAAEKYPVKPISFIVMVEPGGEPMFSHAHSVRSSGQY